MTDGPAEGAQARAVECAADRMLVVGGPGTGKTRTALLLARRLLEGEAGPGARRVLFLTFSRSAVSELLDRAPTLLPPALASRVEVSTFHGFACAVLDAFGRYAGLGTERVAVASEAEQKLGVEPPGALTYEQLIPAAIGILERAAWVRERVAGRYAAVICDEYQDTNGDQDRLLGLLGDGRRLVCLADDDQMIYDFIPGVGPRRLADFRATAPVEIVLEPASHRDPTGVMPALAAALRDRRTTDAVVTKALEVGRLVVTRSAEDWPDAVEAVKSLRRAGHQSVGVFVSKREFVEELARALADAGVRHEIAGLDAAAGEAQAAVAAMAGFAVGTVGFEEVRTRLAVFLAAAQPKHNPPSLAVWLVSNPAALPRPVRRHLAELEGALAGLGGEPVADLFARAATAVSIFGWGHTLWRLGVRDLYGQSIAAVRRPLDPESARFLLGVAAARRAESLTSDLGLRRTPVRIMTMHQAKGREMDAVLIVHHPDDYLPDAAKHARVLFVAVSRARWAVMVQVAASPHRLYAPLGGLTPLPF